VRAVYERCCGMDVHKKTVVACVITPEGRETRTFSTMTGELLELADWLGERGVTHVAMESTGVFWKPVYNLLEERFTVWVVNAYHMKAVPGRKTDVQDAEWIAELLQHGLVRASFIPDRPQRELRELLRHRRSLIQQRADVVNRIQKVLEGANIKLSSVASDVVGVSGRAMLEALVAGEQNPERLADLAKGQLQQKREQLVEALQGRVGAHQRLLLQSHLRHLDFLDGEVQQLSGEVERRTAPFEDAVQRLDAIPGIGRRTAEQVLGEIGLDMGRFPSAEHLASWARLCPGNNQSGGKRKSSITGHANPWLRSALTRPPKLSPTPKIPISPPSIIASPPAGERNGPSSPLLTPCWSLSTTCSAEGPLTTILEETTSTTEVEKPSSATPFGVSNTWATG